ncbi:MAG: hypothetical protein IKS41_00060 [Alphaproteobacteria bacterium]|nr:hypothetical protein [Alphaproteobacteria bacterium]
MKIIKRNVQLKDGTIAEIEEHPKTEMPAHYPEKTDLLDDGTLVLSGCHSKYYIPTPTSQAILAKKIQAAKSWGYLTKICGRERSA